MRPRRRAEVLDAARVSTAAAISASFDGMVDDFYHLLRADDYAWVTHELASLVLPCRGRIVSVLEGGYSLHTPPRPPTAQPRGGTRSKAVAPPDPSAVETADVTSDVTSPAGAMVGDGGLVNGVLPHVEALVSAAAPS